MSSFRTPPLLAGRLQSSLSRLLTTLSDHRHQVTRVVAQRRLPPGSRRTLFFFLGYIARADGRVTEEDVRFAENLITALQLSPRRRSHAITQFHKGRDCRELPKLSGTGVRLLQLLRPQSALLVALCLCHAAQLHGRPGKPRRYRCEDAINQMGLPLEIIDTVFASYADNVWQPPHVIPDKPVSYDEACKVLGVSRRDSFPVIKKAYRVQVSRYHPDKLGTNITRAEQARARDQLLRLQQAWEIIRRRERITR